MQQMRLILITKQYKGQHK